MRFSTSVTAAIGLAAGTQAQRIFARSEASAADPRDGCPGYRAKDITATADGLYARLELAGEPCDVYGADVQNLTLKVTFESENRLRVIIEDAEELAYQIPESALPQPEADDSVSMGKLKFSFDPEPFSFAVSRADSGEVLFDSSAAGLIFEVQYLRLRTSLPEDPNLYGLAEHADSFRLETEDYVRTLWNRDAYGTGDHQNLYSSHPIYFEHRAERGTHGVFLRNSDGMDVIINRTAEGAQFLEYNVIGGVLDLTFLAGPGPKEVSQQYAECVGLPVMFPYWAFGFNQCRYGYQDAYAVAEMIYNYSQAGIPLETAWIDIDYMDRRKVFTNDPERFPMEMLREIVDHLHSNNQYFTMMVDPAVAFENNTAYEHGMELDIFLKKPDGELFKGVVWPGVTVFPDWFHPNIEEYWTSEFAAFFDAETGVDLDQCWIDMSDPSSFGCEFGCNPAEVVAESDMFPPEPPPVRAPPRPLPGWSCAFQPEGTDCEEFVDPNTGNSTSRRRRRLLARQDDDDDSGDDDSAPTKHTGLPGRDLLYPEYSIHNMWANQPDWNDQEGGLSNYTVQTDVVHAHGLAEYDVHNLFGHMMTVLTRKALLARRPGRRPSIIGRSTFAGSGAHGGKWTGDNASSWWHYLLSIRSCLGFAISQNPFVGADVCGFGGNATEQLCARWAMLGAFTPFYRNHNDITGTGQEFYVWESVAAAARKAIDIRYRLLDYMYTAFRRQTVDGTPTLSPMWFHYPRDRATFGIESQFFYGDALLVAPVTEENATAAEVYLPDGAVFYDWFTGEKVVGAGRNMTVRDQGWSDIPLYVAGGHIVPLRVRSAMTTAEVREQDFELLVAIGADGTARGELYLDDGDGVEQPATSEIAFEFAANGTLRTTGKYDYPTTSRIVRVTFLGTDILSAGGGNGTAAARPDGGVAGKAEVEVEAGLDGEFTLEVDF